MVMRFESKRDWTFPIIWAFVFLVYSFIGFFIVMEGGHYFDLILLFVVWIGIGLLFYLFLITTYYTLEEDELICHVLGFKKRILVKEIRKIETKKGLYAGLKINTSWKGLVISYGKWDEILISPADEVEFISAIQAKNPTLQV